MDEILEYVSRFKVEFPIFNKVSLHITVVSHPSVLRLFMMLH